MHREGRLRKVGTAKDGRWQLALSKEDVARELGVNYATVNCRENGLSKPSLLAMKKIEDLLRALDEKVKTSLFPVS